MNKHDKNIAIAISIFVWVAVAWAIIIAMLTPQSEKDNTFSYRAQQEENYRIERNELVTDANKYMLNYESELKNVEDGMAIAKKNKDEVRVHQVWKLFQ